MGLVHDLTSPYCHPYLKKISLWVSKQDYASTVSKQDYDLIKDIVFERDWEIGLVH